MKRIICHALSRMLWFLTGKATSYRTARVMPHIALYCLLLPYAVCMLGTLWLSAGRPSGGPPVDPIGCQQHQFCGLSVRCSHVIYIL